MGFSLTVKFESGRTAVYWVPARFDVASVYAKFPVSCALSWSALQTRRPRAATYHIREV